MIKPTKKKKTPVMSADARRRRLRADDAVTRLIAALIELHEADVADKTTDYTMLPIGYRGPLKPYERKQNAVDALCDVLACSSVPAIGRLTWA